VFFAIQRAKKGGGGWVWGDIVRGITFIVITGGGEELKKSLLL